MAPDPAALHRLPAVDRVLRTPAAVEAIARHGRPLTVAAVRDSLEAARAALRAGAADGTGPEAIDRRSSGRG